MLGKNKYVMLAAQSSFKGKSDRSKYEKAMRLKGAIGKIRADYKKNLNSKDLFNRQLGRPGLCIRSALLNISHHLRSVLPERRSMREVCLYKI